ncbi:hypothetical protein, partial [Blastococcus mobilis]
RSELTTTILAPGELADLVERMLRTSGRRIDMSTPKAKPAKSSSPFTHASHHPTPSPWGLRSALSSSTG